MSRANLQVLTRHACSAALLTATLGLAAANGAAQLTPELVARVQWMEETAISPDGQWVAYIRSTAARPGNASKGRARELFLIPAGGGETRLLVSAELSPHKPAWSPDGAFLAFLGVSQEPDARQHVYRVPLHGGEPRPLTDAATDIRAFAFSPDGRSLAYLAAQEPSDSVGERERAGYDAVVYGEPRLHVRLWVKNLPGGVPRPITPTDRTVRTFAWAPDGKAFALQVTEVPTGSRIGTSVVCTLSPRRGASSPCSPEPRGRWATWPGLRTASGSRSSAQHHYVTRLRNQCSSCRSAGGRWPIEPRVMRGQRSG